ncbi:paralemmin 1a [Corythoichthys intestinalis]|uniref:paralemmin 1a n=1 Tax=Corythoichthys intestinalis TaxID=161448 RepID=UPI0025A61D01|nr:paralemmin 1a [Corythoichthys intestinalis]XP_057697827.1 paralemmin 1a [Corythoichthys intestinalis]
MKRAVYSVEIKVERDKSTGETRVLSSHTKLPVDCSRGGVKVYEDEQKVVHEVNGQEGVRPLSAAEVDELILKADLASRDEATARASATANPDEPDVPQGETASTEREAPLRKGAAEPDVPPSRPEVSPREGVAEPEASPREGVAEPEASPREGVAEPEAPPREGIVEPEVLPSRPEASTQEGAVSESDLQGGDGTTSRPKPGTKRAGRHAGDKKKSRVCCAVM